MNRPTGCRQLAGWLLLMVVLLLGACRDAPKFSALPVGSTVLAFGDSITFGSGAANGEDYPSHLAALSGWRMINAGIPGDTAVAARERIGAAIADTHPALVIVEIGGNDFLRRRPEAAVKEDLRAIIATVKQSGTPLVLVAVPRLSVIGAVTGKLPDSPIYGELASDEKLPLVEGVLATILAAPDLKADPIHPNADGYRKLAEGIAERLRRSGLLSRP